MSHVANFDSVSGLDRAIRALRRKGVVPDILRVPLPEEMTQEQLERLERGDFKLVREKPILAQVVFREEITTGKKTIEHWDGDECGFLTPSEALQWVNRLSYRPDFVLGMVRDSITGLVTKVEPRTEEAAAE